ncbi:MAG: radical SAM protein [Desulfuromonas sp.]|nr:MAG: radical SAM protein [Desulfuromonas sp.]
MRILPIFIPHAGCAEACVFCSQTRTSAVSGMPDPEETRNLIEQSLVAGPIDQVAFYGGSFTALPSDEIAAWLGLVQPYIKRGVVGGIRLSTRPDALDKTMILQLKSASVTTIELGCQSFSDKVLDSSGRGHSAADSVRAAVMIRTGGIQLGLQLMPGLPGSSRSEALSSLDQALALAPDFLRIYPTVVLAGTALANLWRQGGYTPLSLEEAVSICTEIALICRQADVPIIRFGLQSNSGLDSEAVLAGPYHPAFGQLVRSRLWLSALESLANERFTSVSVHPHDFSDAIGHRRCNLERLQQRGNNFSIECDSQVEKGFIAVGCQARPVAEVSRLNFRR